MQLDDRDAAYLHLKNGLAIDFEFLGVIKELYPGFFKVEEVKTIISEFKE